MCYKLEENNWLHYGWQHILCNPGNVYLNEYVKGPFTTPQLVCSYPFVTHCQKYSDGSPLVLRQGIPDSWAEYLTQIFNDLFLSYEPMHKDLDIVRTLRKDYRLYIGQGIPDPWSAYPYLENFDASFTKNLELDSRKYLRLLQSGKNRRNVKESCLCCKKAFLFECPDKNKYNVNSLNNGLNCSCQDCHGNNEVSDDLGENCKCIKTLQNWVLENINFFRGNEQVPFSEKEPLESSLSLPSSLKPERTSENSNEKINSHFQTSSQDHYINNEHTLAEESSNSHNKYAGLNKNGFLSNSEKNFKRVSQEKPIKICFCSFLKKIKERDSENKNGENDYYEYKNSAQGKEKSHSSKQVQTDLSFLHNEKQSVKKSDYKLQQKCYCNKKCLYGRFFKSSEPEINLKSQAIPNLCFSHCPYVCTNYFTVEKLHQHNSQELNIRKNKKLREKKTCTKLPNCCKLKEEHKETKTITRCESGRDDESVKTNNSLDTKIYYCQASTMPFRYKKHPTDLKLKKYHIEKEYLSETPQGKFDYNPMPTYMTPKFRNIYEQRTSKGINSYYDNSSNRRNIPIMKKYLEHLRENNMRKNKVFCSASVQTTPVSRTKENKKEVPTKLKYLNEMVESDESRTYGLIRNSQKPRKGIKKSKRILVNKKSRKLAERKSYFLNKQTKTHLANLQADKTYLNSDINPITLYPNSKKVSFDFDDKSTSVIRNFSRSKLLSSRENVFPEECSNTFTYRLKQIEQNVPVKKLVNLNDTVFPTKQHQEKLDLNSVLNRTSQNSETTWSSNTLKSIVDDLLDKPSPDLKNKERKNQFFK